MLEQCKNKIREDCDYKHGDLTDELVDSFVDKTVIHNNFVEVHMNFANKIGDFLNKPLDREDSSSVLLVSLLLQKMMLLVIQSMTISYLEYI